jgi:bacteriorhodopsin
VSSTVWNLVAVAGLALLAMFPLMRRFRSTLLERLRVPPGGALPVLSDISYLSIAIVFLVGGIIGALR